VEQVDRPTLVMAPNKTLAAQLYAEFKALFPGNAVEYFVSYYDYYQPEAYIPSTDTYIEKDSSINDEIDKLRHSATHALLTRSDVLVVASVSAIYGLGAPETYGSMHVYIETGAALVRDDLLRRLVDMLYERNDHDFHRGTFRVRGDVVEIFPQYEAERAIRVEFFGDEIDSIAEIDPLRGVVIGRPKRAMIYPASHYVATDQILSRAIDGIRGELQERLAFFREQGKLLEAQRLEQRTMYDLEMLEEMGFCHGVENYSRWLDGREAGETPYTLHDYFPDDLLVVLDESHVSVPQIAGMYRGDRARKETLVEYGWRLPSALDNRPLRFDEWEARAPQRLYVSATPADYELEKSKGVVVEQIIRPTGLVDPQVEVRPFGEESVYDILWATTVIIERGALENAETTKGAGKKAAAEVDHTALHIAEIVRPKLVEDGMFLVGLDIVGDKLMEINVFTPGGLGSARQFENVNFAHAVINALERKVDYMKYYRRNFNNVDMATL